MGFRDLAAQFIPLPMAEKRDFSKSKGLQGEFIAKRVGKVDREVSFNEVADLSLLREAQNELAIAVK